MKKVLVLFAILSSIAIIAYSNLANKQTVREENEVLGSPVTTTTPNVYVIESGGQKYEVTTIPVESIDGLSLHSNLSDPKNSTELLEANNCVSLVNAGFYTKENTPVGYLKTSDGQVKIAKDSSLFNGYLTVNDIKTPRITRDLPRDQIEIGVQSGPILIENSFPNNLLIKNDKEARRMVAITTGDNELIFLSFYKPTSMFSGPLLQNLPKVLDSWQKASGIIIADAINLDGGTASAMITNQFKVSEASPIGSYFCISQK